MEGIKKPKRKYKLGKKAKNRKKKEEKRKNKKETRDEGHDLDLDVLNVSAREAKRQDHWRDVSCLLHVASLFTTPSQKPGHLTFLSVALSENKY